MENLKKLKMSYYSDVFLKRGNSIDYIGNAGYLSQQYWLRFFGSKFAIEKAIAQNNFVRCDLCPAFFDEQKEAIICGTTNQKKCHYVEQLLMKEKFGSIPDPAMQNLGKLMVKDSETNVFFQTDDSLQYTTTVRRLPYYSLNRWGIHHNDLEKNIAEKNFVHCNFSNEAKGIVFGTTDKRKCSQAEQLFFMEQEKERLRQEELRREPEHYECNCEGCNRDPESCSDGVCRSGGY
jgi:hypothetical protein